MVLRSNTNSSLEGFLFGFSPPNMYSLWAIRLTLWPPRCSGTTPVVATSLHAHPIGSSLCTFMGEKLFTFPLTRSRRSWPPTSTTDPLYPTAACPADGGSPAVPPSDDEDDEDDGTTWLHARLSRSRHHVSAIYLPA